ncbi:MAG: thymidine kinase [Myxococcales bacterium]|nr:thymidine kinase [Myxococcales bacterium]MCB9644577.1 thymidine kinase [Myxococcales bacterium]
MHALRNQRRGGRIEVICGPMFSGKTEEMLRRLHREQIAGRRPMVMIPPRGRYQDKIESRQGEHMSAIAASNASAALQLIKEHEWGGPYAVIAFDEAQWFEDLLEASVALANAGHRVIVAGLDMDYAGRPFLPMALTMCAAEQVTKLTAVGRCDCEATHTARLGDGEDEGGTWEPMCRLCWKDAAKESNPSRVFDMET